MSLKQKERSKYLAQIYTKTGSTLAHIGTAFFVLGVGFVSSYFTKDLILRLVGVISAAVIFFLITNFGVWTSGMYGYTFQGLLNCFVLAIPFFTFTLISTLIYSVIIETFFKIYKVKILKI